MDRRTVLKGGFALATTSHTAIADLPMLAQAAESDHGRLKRLAWEISDLLNGLEPGVDFVSIRPSAVGRGAVFFGWDIEQETAQPADPLLETIQEYTAGIEEFNRLSKTEVTDENWDAFEDKTFGPSLARLQQWEGPALTRDGAIEALRLALDNDKGVGGMEAADRMFNAVLAYLEGLS